MKVLLFLLAFGSLSACEKKPAGYSKQEMMQETNIIDLVKKMTLLG